MEQVDDVCISLTDGRLGFFGSAQNGVMRIDRVDPDTAAARAGMPLGVLRAIDGVEIRTDEDIETALLKARSVDQQFAVFTVLRESPTADPVRGGYQRSEAPHAALPRHEPAGDGLLGSAVNAASRAIGTLAAGFGGWSGRGDAPGGGADDLWGKEAELLQEMGFGDDEDRNRRLLREFGGDVEKVVSRIMDIRSSQFPPGSDAGQRSERRSLPPPGELLPPAHTPIPAADSDRLRQAMGAQVLPQGLCERVFHIDIQFPGNQVGIDITDDTVPGPLRVVEVFPGTPAARAGMMSGMQLVRIHNYAVATYSEGVTAMRRVKELGLTRFHMVQLVPRSGSQHDQPAPDFERWRAENERRIRLQARGPPPAAVSVHSLTTGDALTFRSHSGVMVFLSAAEAFDGELGPVHMLQFIPREGDRDARLDLPDINRSHRVDAEGQRQQLLALMQLAAACNAECKDFEPLLAAEAAAAEQARLRAAAIAAGAPRSPGSAAGSDSVEYAEEEGEECASPASGAGSGEAPGAQPAPGSPGAGAGAEGGGGGTDGAADGAAEGGGPAPQGSPTGAPPTPEAPATGAAEGAPPAAGADSSAAAGAPSSPAADPEQSESALGQQQGHCNTDAAPPERSQ
eukprot:TRINITY_DN26399_c0_g1_i1.p1 TRINITY_DN26399_c0_g1~~TRINITY_DN26399_c0_g1_i1.p1  ORF type:complete len:655 (+),score=160.65 TRINITY_DN26399_c0_g1_i1:87-1967(+)